MRPKPLYRDRYPGLIPFDKGQSTIFFGRDQEKKELYYQVSLEKMVVLFGKSGLGKSSLLNAGVSPMLEKSGYLPIRVRFTSGSQASTDEGSENLLLRDLRMVLREPHYTTNILFNKDAPRLWEHVKAARYNEFIDQDLNRELSAWTTSRVMAESAEKTNTVAATVIPVFIFDQFEEFFHHPVKHQQEFLDQLAEIVHEETPYRILDWITSMEPEERTAEQVNWSQQPIIKIVFALRSDSLASMQSLVSYIPTVLRTRYELKPLTPEQAAQAIKGPAEKKDLEPGYTPPFSFEENTLTGIITELRGKTNEIESSQLQMVCHFIEERIRKDLMEKGGTAGMIVNDSIINPARDFEAIRDDFYESQLAKIEEPENREIARKLIEDDLVSGDAGNEIRDSISKNKLLDKYKIDEDLIEEITNTRLIREETTNWGSTFELSHDTLVQPVVKSKNRRRDEEERKKEQEEKIILADLAKKKDEELKEKYRQLATEMQLREEAERQKAEVQRLAKKVRSRGMWVFLLTLVMLIAAVALLLQVNKNREFAINAQQNTQKKLDSTRNSILISSLNEAQNKANLLIADSTSTINPPKDVDSTKASILTLISDADSISKIAKDGGNKANAADTAIDKMIESVFLDDFKKRHINTKKLTTSQKIDTLKKIISLNKVKKIYTDDNLKIRLQFKD
jgi:energy-coupling factor transporter ATP-binding protein EcfA2